jgi:shikimate kinase
VTVPPGKVLLVGMMGAGKTTVGESLASRLEWPYLDNDALLMRTTGTTAAHLEASQGAEALHKAESQILTLVLGMPKPLVAGVAGGVVLDETDCSRIQDSGAHVVWLRASPKVLARRLSGGINRPLLGGDPESALRALAAERHPGYEKIATQVVDVDALTAGMAAKEIVSALGG